MTNKEAKDKLYLQWQAFLEHNLDYAGVSEAYKMAFKALEEQEPTDNVSRGVFEQVMGERDIAIEQLNELGYELGQKIEPCDDAISRQYLLDNCVVDKVTMPYVPISKIENAPSVTQNPKTGHWIRKLIRNEKGGCIGAEMVCSKCGEDNGYDKYMNYCPNCGAKMVEPQERSK